MLRGFSISNYKGFAMEQEIEVAPLTLFFGQNSSGKSTLLRMLPWLAESSSDRRPGPRLDGEVAREATWDDLVNVSAPTSPIKLALSWHDGTSVHWELRSGSIGRTCEIAKVTCRDDSRATTLSDDGDHIWQSIDGPTGASLHGMIPQGPGVPTLFEVIGKKLDALDVQWVAGVRAPLGRVVSVGGTPPSDMGSGGRNAARHLYFWDRMHSQDPRRMALQDFFGRLGSEVSTEDVAQKGGLFRVVVKPVSGPGIPVNVVDTGEGFTQVIPALVALGRAEAGIGPQCVAIEQPELHLHTDAQRALAETLAAIVQRGKVQILAETHSEVLLAALQLSVAMGKLSHDKVVIYWVYTRPDGVNRAERVTLDRQGKVVGPWPVDAFSDLLRIRTELHRARLGAQ